jgi:PIN domain nuclease of toxin-antitoxin system
MVLLDTHILVDAVNDDLRRVEIRVLHDAWSISDIVLWELGHLERQGRIAPVLRTPAFSRALRRIDVIPIDEQIVLAIRQLDFRSDPADEIIAATSLVHGIPLLTRDGRILSSKVVPLALR